MLAVFGYTFAVTWLHSDMRFHYEVLQLQCATHAEKCSVYLTQQQEIPLQFSFQISASDLKDL